MADSTGWWAVHQTVSVGPFPTSAAAFDYADAQRGGRKGWKVEFRGRPTTLIDAAQAVLDAYGGDWPDWLKLELGALESALEEVRCERS